MAWEPFPKPRALHLCVISNPIPNDIVACMRKVCTLIAKSAVRITGILPLTPPACFRYPHGNLIEIAIF